MTDPKPEIQTAIQNNPPTPGALLTGWVLMSEWMAPDGQRWLSRLNADNLTEWGADGMLHNALFSDWNYDPIEED